MRSRKRCLLRDAHATLDKRARFHMIASLSQLMHSPYLMRLICWLSCMTHLNLLPSLTRCDAKTKRRLCAMATPRRTAVWGSLRLGAPAASLSVKSRRKAMQSVYEARRVEKTNAKNDIKTKTTAPTAPAASSETKKRRISPKLPGELCSDAHEASPARAGTLQKEMLLPLMTGAVSDAKADDASAAAEAAAASAAAEAADASATAEAAAAAAAAKAGAGAELQCQSDLNPVAESEDKCRCRSSAGATDAEAAEYARVTAELRTELGRSMAMVQKLHSDVTAAKGNIAKAKRRLAALHDQNERSNRVCFMAMALCRRQGFEQELRELSDYIQKQRVDVRPFEHTG